MAAKGKRGIQRITDAISINSIPSIQSIKANCFSLVTDSEFKVSRKTGKTVVFIQQYLPVKCGITAILKPEIIGTMFVFYNMNPLDSPLIIRASPLTVTNLLS
jgi:hypothetical protein